MLFTRDRQTHRERERERERERNDEPGPSIDRTHSEAQLQRIRGLDAAPVHRRLMDGGDSGRRAIRCSFHGRQGHQRHMDCEDAGRSRAQAPRGTADGRRSPRSTKRRRRWHTARSGPQDGAGVGTGTGVGTPTRMLSLSLSRFPTCSTHGRLVGSGTSFFFHNFQLHG